MVEGAGMERMEDGVRVPECTFILGLLSRDETSEK